MYTCTHTQSTCTHKAPPSHQQGLISYSARTASHKNVEVTLVNKQVYVCSCATCRAIIDIIEGEATYFLSHSSQR